MNSTNATEAAKARTRPSALVWIDAREAVIVRLEDAGPHLERVASDVPAHHRSTGDVAHDPRFRHGGPGPAAAGEPHRIEHLRRFVDDVADRLQPDEDLVILGQGTVREQLQRTVQRRDERHRSPRAIACETAGRLTDRQLVARLRRAMGTDPRRRTVGAYRWTEPTLRLASDGAVPEPRRVVEKRPSRGTD
jgi:hypothetical protein